MDLFGGKAFEYLTKNRDHGYWHSFCCYANAFALNQSIGCTRRNSRKHIQNNFVLNEIYVTVKQIVLVSFVMKKIRYCILSHIHNNKDNIFEIVSKHRPCLDISDTSNNSHPKWLKSQILHCHTALKIA